VKGKTVRAPGGFLACHTPQHLPVSGSPTGNLVYHAILLEKMKIYYCNFAWVRGGSARAAGQGRGLDASGEGGIPGQQGLVHYLIRVPEDGEGPTHKVHVRIRPRSDG